MKPITKYACELDRIYGTETEYGLYWKGGKTDIFEVVNQDFARTILDCEYFSSRVWPEFGAPVMNDVFLKNGGLIKKDNTDGHNDCTPEYATPECRAARDAVCWEKAGEVIMHNLFDLSGRNSSIFLMVKHGRGFAAADREQDHHLWPGHRGGYFSRQLQPLPVQCACQLRR